MTHSSAYSPKPGSVPHRVLEVLRALPAGTELDTAHLAAAAGFDTKQAAALLACALAAGALKRRQADSKFWRSPLLWSLGDGARVPIREVRAMPRAAPRSVFEVSPALRYQHTAPPASAPSSFLDEWRRLRGEGA